MKKYLRKVLWFFLQRGVDKIETLIRLITCIEHPKRSGDLSGKI